MLELRAPRDAVTARIVVPPVAFLDDPEAERLAEQFIKTRIPPRWHALLLPQAIAATETLKPVTPGDYYDVLHQVSLIRGLLHAK